MKHDFLNEIASKVGNAMSEGNTPQPRAGADCLIYQIFFGASLIANVGMGIHDFITSLTFADLKNQIQILQKNLNQCNTDRTKCEDEKKMCLEDYDPCVRELGVMKEFVLHNVTVYENITEENALLKEKIKTQQEIITKLTDFIKRQNKTVELQSETITALTISHSLVMKGFELQQVSIKKKNKIIEDQAKDITRKNYTITGLQLSNGILKQAIEAQNVVLEEKKGIINQQINTMKKMDFTISSLESNKLIMNKAVGEANIFIDKLNTIIQALKQDIEKLNAYVKELLNIIYRQNFSIEGFKASMSVLETTITAQKEIIASMNSTIRVQASELLRKNFTVAHLEGANTLLNYSARVLMTENIEQGKTIESLGKRLNESEMKCAVNATEWLKMRILESVCEKKVELIPRYSAPKEQCGTDDFHDKMKNVAPSVFIATESKTNLQFGGFTTQTFDPKTDFKEDKHAFTFSYTSRNTCLLKNPKEAIFAGKWKGNPIWPDYGVLGYGNHDIWIKSSCLSKPSEIQLGKTYTCPKNGLNYFYTSTNNPQLVNFTFYEVKFVSP